MGISLSTAQILAPLSFAVDFGAQLYGMLSTPNMKQIHDRNMAAFSPYANMIGYFFFPQQLLQLWWLRRLWTNPEPDQVKYVPYYALGNFCIAGWMLFWNSENFGASQALVTINTLSQLFYVTTMLPPRTPENTLTHLVAKTFAGIGVLDLLHNGAVALYPGVAPNTLVKALTGVGFGLGALASDGIIGFCLVYDLFSLYLGQQGDWKMLLGAYTLGAAGIVGAKVGLNLYDRSRKAKHQMGSQGSDESI